MFDAQINDITGIPTRCPKCGGALYRNEDKDFECLCGKIIYRLEPEPMKPHNRGIAKSWMKRKA